MLTAAGQTTHFVQNDGMNVFRLPVGCQFLTGGEPTVTLKMENFEKYDKLVQACLATGASCIVDMQGLMERYDAAKSGL